VNYCLTFGPLTAQQNVVTEHITTADGLSQGFVYDILQDAEGFLWLGTKDGLNRYDGYNFEVFTNDPDDKWSIAGNAVTYLFEDSKGRIWASTENVGVDIYDKRSGRFYHLNFDPSNPHGITGTNIREIIEDTSGYFLLNVDEREINMLTIDDAFFNEEEPLSVIRIPIPNQDLNSQIPGALLNGMS
jgi:ligand-binding sensor domain-containing protein